MIIHMDVRNLHCDFEARIPSPNGLAMAIGNFDGVHLGHQQTLKAVFEYAKEHNLTPAALSFQPHPQEFFNPESTHFTLTTLEQKYALLQEIGIKNLYLLKFNEALSVLSPKNFVEEVLIKALKIKAVSVGNDFRFGKNRKGDITLLEDYGKQFNFSLLPNHLLTLKEEVISSSAIRHALRVGKPEKAALLLGRPWCFEASVIHGDKRGRDLGYPTANLQLPQYANIKEGVYAVRITTENEIYDGVASYGRRPQFDNGTPLFEVHLFDFSGDLYDKTLKIDLIAFQREEQKFSSVEGLIQQMDKDSLKAKEHIAQYLTSG